MIPQSLLRLARACLTLICSIFQLLLEIVRCFLSAWNVDFRKVFSAQEFVRDTYHHCLMAEVISGENAAGLFPARYAAKQ